jgi:capsular polysaccharide biosynthesis protein
LAMRNRLLQGAGITDPAPTGRPVYISRRHRSKSRSQRRILNEEEVVKVLEAFGFEVYVPEEHPFAEQVRRFASASAIACAHGAGSYNQLFAPRGIPLIELFNPACWEHSAVRFASLLEQPHHHLFGRNRTIEHDFEVNCERLRRLTAKALGEDHLSLCAETEY